MNPFLRFYITVEFFTNHKGRHQTHSAQNGELDKSRAALGMNTETFFTVLLIHFCVTGMKQTVERFHL